MFCVRDTAVVVYFITGDVGSSSCYARVIFVNGLACKYIVVFRQCL